MGRVVPLKKRGKWLIFFSSSFSSSAKGCSGASPSGLLCTLVKHVGEILQWLLTGISTRKSSTCMGKGGPGDEGGAMAGRCRCPSRQDSCFAWEWLADSLPLSMPSGSSSGLELRFCSAWGDPPANDWARWRFKGLSILPQVWLCYWVIFVPLRPPPPPPS